MGKARKIINKLGKWFDEKTQVIMTIETVCDDAYKEAASNVSIRYNFQYFESVFDSQKQLLGLVLNICDEWGIKLPKWAKKHKEKYLNFVKDDNIVYATTEEYTYNKLTDELSDLALQKGFLREDTQSSGISSLSDCVRCLEFYSFTGTETTTTIKADGHVDQSDFLNQIIRAYEFHTGDKVPASILSRKAILDKKHDNQCTN